MGDNMIITIICGNDDCRTEFSTNTEEPFWTCTHCGREIENRFFPFLTAQLMDAQANSATTDWNIAYQRELKRIEEFIVIKTEEIRTKIPSYIIPEEYSIDRFVPTKETPVASRDSFDELIEHGHKTAIFLINILNELKK